jgi:hypothetical protein
MEGAQKLVLYSYFRSSTSWRVRIALNHKQIPHDFKFIHLVKSEQQSEEYVKVNPNAVTTLPLRPYPLWPCPPEKS